MLFINATLSKNQMYKLKNQISKIPTISKQDDIEFFSKYFCKSFYQCLQFTFVLSEWYDFHWPIPGGYVEE